MTPEKIAQGAGTIWQDDKKYALTSDIGEATHYAWPGSHEVQTIPDDAWDNGSQTLSLEMNDFEVLQMPDGVVSGPIKCLEYLGLKLYREEPISSTDLELSSMKAALAELAEKFESVLRKMGENE